MSYQKSPNFGELALRQGAIEINLARFANGPTQTLENENSDETRLAPIQVSSDADSPLHL